MSRMLSRTLQATSTRHRPRHIALAVAVGVVCGLLPKLSVLFVVLAVAACLLPLHLPLAFATAFIVGALTESLLPLAGHLGVASLTHPATQSVWLRFNALPLASWLQLDNSLQNGRFVLGGLLFGPVLFVTHGFAAGWWLAILRASLNRTTNDPHTMAAQVPLVVPATQVALTADPDRRHEPRPAVGHIDPLYGPPKPLHFQADQSLAPVPEFLAAAGSDDLAVTDDINVADDITDSEDDAENGGLGETADPLAAVELRELLDASRGEDAAGNTQDVLKRAVEMAGLVGELLDHCEQEDEQCDSDDMSTDLPSESDATHARCSVDCVFSDEETLTEFDKHLSPYRIDSAAAVPPAQSLLIRPATSQGLGSQGSGDAAYPSRPSALENSDEYNARDTDKWTSRSSHEDAIAADAAEPRRSVVIDERHEEALRYLLHHLKELKNRV